jgi:translation initiation factor IF-1
VAKEEAIVMRGCVIEAAPGARFKVRLDNGHVLNAVINGKIRKNNIQIILDDKVEVEMSPYDMGLARIIYRF